MVILPTENAHVVAAPSSQNQVNDPCATYQLFENLARDLFRSWKVRQEVIMNIPLLRFTRRNIEMKVDFRTDRRVN
jgi:hypothetical protein